MEELKLPSHEIPSKLDPRIIERWIDDTLADCEYLDIPGVILKPDSKTGDDSRMTRYRIDRLSMIKSKVPQNTINRIYRGLFVYSIGFSELIKSALEHTEK